MGTNNIKQRLALGLVVMISSSLLYGADSGPLQGKFIPPAGKVLVLMGQDIKAINTYLKATSEVPAGFSVYTSAEFADGLDTRVDHGGGVQHTQKLIERYPNTILLLGLWMVDTEQRILEGLVDESVDYLASWIKKTKRPVYLRIGYEFDYPDNHYEPDLYVRAYRAVVDRFRQQGVTNVAYVWHSYAGYVSRPHRDWYPGDDYVDWVAISYFRQPHKFMDPVAAFAKERNKPFMIAEASPWHVPTTNGLSSWKQWFVPLFYFMEEKDVKFLAYINCDWDNIPLFKKHKWGDARVQSNKVVFQRWNQEIGQEKYLKSSPGLFQDLGFK